MNAKIAISCSGCGQRLQVERKEVERKGRCPKCQATVTIPALPSSEAESKRAAATVAAERASGPSPPQPAATRSAPAKAPVSSAKPAARRLSEAMIRHAFQEETPRVRKSFAYAFAASLVAAFMVLLPIIYLGMIGLLGWGVYWHATTNTQILTYGHGRARLIPIIIYLAPIIAGAITCLFLVKPLFARRSRDSRIRRLTQEGEPLLFALIEEICEQVGSPVPSEVHVNCQINASAGFRRGLWSMLVGSDLVLTIGLPLAAGLTVQEFTGVLAHEFGHFSQGIGMRLSYIIRAISHWFLRVVYERDRWDDMIDQAISEMDFRIGIIFFAARFSVWMGRQLLKALMWIGHGAGGILLRQMEYDADQYETLVVGTPTFINTSRKLFELNIAWRETQRSLQTFHRDGRLADDIPLLLMLEHRQIPAEARRKMREVQDEMTTGFWDTHPSDPDRMEKAKQLDAPGVFHSQEPASQLFRNFASISRSVTEDFYREIFGKPVPKQMLLPTQQLVGKQLAEAQESQAAFDYFQQAIKLPRSVPLPVLDASFKRATPQSLASAKQLWQTADDAIMSQLEDYRQTREKWDGAFATFLKARQAHSLLRGGVSAKQAKLTPELATVEKAAAVRDKAQAMMSRIESKLEPFETSCGQKLVAGVQLALSAAASPEQQAKSQRRCETLFSLLRTANSYHATVMTILQHSSALNALLAQWNPQAPSESLHDAIVHLAKDIFQQLQNLRRQMADTVYPFPHTQNGLKLSHFLMGDQGHHATDFGGILAASEQLLDRYFDYYFRLLSQLTKLAIVQPS